MAAAYALGIDVGTSFTAAATWRDGRAQTVPLGDRANMVPSVVFLRDDGVLLAGDAADRSAVSEPARAARQFKRRVGGEVPVLLGGEPFSPQALVAAMVDWVVRRVAEREGAPPAHVTLTCPANWGERRRRLVLEAAGPLGLAGVDLTAAPVAAATWYACKEPVEPGAVVAVYDLGGGLDAAVLRRTEDGFEPCGEPGGDDSLGGVDLDRLVVDHVGASLGIRWSSLDVGNPAVLRALAQVQANAVEAKEALSSDLEASVTVILPGVAGEVRLTRAQLEGMARAPLLSTVEKLGRVIAGGAVARPGAVLLVGGSSRIPLVSALIAGELGLPVTADVHPKFAVCLGAATVAGRRMQPLPASAPPAVGAPAAASSPPGAGADTALLLGGPQPAEMPQELMLALPSRAEPEARRPPPPRAGAATPGPPPTRHKPLPVVDAVPVAVPEAVPEASAPGPPPRSAAAPPPLSPAGPPGAAAGGAGRRPLHWTSLAAIAAVAALLAGGLVWWLGPLGGSRVASRAPATTALPPTTASAATPQPSPPAWAELPKAPAAFEAAGAAVFGNKVWLAGGLDERRKASAGLLVFDPTGQTWRPTLIALPQAVSHAALVSTGGTLLLIGGYQGSGPDAALTPLAATWQLSLATSRWAAGPPLPTPLGAGAAAWDGRRVVFAGGAGAGRRPSAAVLALENGAWRQLGSLPHARERLAAATDGNGRVWFAGGEVDDGGPRATFGEVDLVEGDSVRQAGQVPTPRGSVAGFWAGAGMGVCAAGGRDRGGAMSAQVECVDPAGRVRSLPRLPTARRGLSTVAVGGVVYALGGTTAGGAASGVAESLRLPS